MEIPETRYKNIQGLEITSGVPRSHKFVLTPGRYVGIPDEEDDGIPFKDKMKNLTETLKKQMDEAQQLDMEIKVQLAKVRFEI